MVTTASSYDFAAIVDALFANKKLSGPHASTITSVVRNRALALLEVPDVRYMPTFKVLDLLAALTNIARAIDDATQLRPGEIEVLLREALADSAPLVRHFTLEAALERARYEPLMIMDAQITDTTSERELILGRRWAAMRAAHQERAKLPDDWIDAVDNAVEAALASEDFQRFRQGPLLQLFAEMLALARHYHQQRQPLDRLTLALSDEGALWRRYALKSARYAEKTTLPVDLFTLSPHSHQLH